MPAPRLATAALPLPISFSLSVDILTYVHIVLVGGDLLRPCRSVQPSAELTD